MHYDWGIFWVTGFLAIVTLSQYADFQCEFEMMRMPRRVAQTGNLKEATE